MSRNPFAPPEAEVADPEKPCGDSIAQLNAIAIRHRLLICAFAIAAASIFFHEPFRGVGLAVNVFSIVVAIVAGVRLSAALGQALWMRFVFGILLAWPSINLGALLILSGQAKMRLRRGGFRVGFLGASPRTFVEAETRRG